MKRFLSIMVLFCAAAVAMAQEQVDTTFNLNEVVVTGTRTPKLLKDTPVQTRLIGSDDIRKADATNIQDLLQTEVPGVEFSYAMNQQTHLNFAGFGGQSVLFLVDGERLAGETMDDVDFQRLTMEGIERIEIVRGASSALYGSNAGGGVINIITRDGARPWALNVNARLARHNSQRYGGSFSINRKHVSNSFDFMYSGIDNYDVTNGPSPQARVFSTVYGDKSLNLKDKLTLRLFDGFRLIGRAGYFYRTLTRTADNPERYRDFSAGLRALWEISDRDNLEAAYTFDEYDKSDYQKITRLDIRDYSNVQNTFRAVWNHSFPDAGILTLGSDFMHDYLLNVNLDGGSRSQDCFDVFAQYDWILSPRWELVCNLRYDYLSDDRKSHLTPKVTARFKASDYVTFRMGYGVGFRAPTLKERYYNFDMAGIWTVIGNPNLRSETSHNFNASVEWTRSHYNFTATAYYNGVRNKIATGTPYYAPQSSTLNPQLFLPYLNLEKYSVCGAEATLQARWDGGFGARLSYAFTKENILGDNDANTFGNQYLPSREHTLTARFEFDRQLTSFYGLNVALHGRYLSGVDNHEYVDYYDISRGTQTVHYPAYTLWKLSTSHRLGKALSITLALDNLFNYRPDYYYLNSPVTDGTNFQLGLSLDIDKL